MINEFDLDLTAKYLSGECSPDESEVVEKWLSESEERRSLFELMKKAWDADEENFESSDIKALWEKVAERSGIKSETEAAPVFELEPEEILSSSSGKSYFTRILSYAALILIIASASLIYFLTPDKLNPDDWISVSVKNGELKSIVLDDGSKIIADAGSFIQYAVNYGKSNRDIYITGEAYFDVIYNPEIPFRVFSGNTVIEVLGTKFNLRSWKESEKISIAVIEGKVSFGSGTWDNYVILGKGFTSDITSSGLIIPVRKIEIAKILSWLDGEIYFENTRLSELLTQLERWYDVRINLADKSIESERLSVFIHNYSLLDNIDMLARLTGTEFKVEGRVITLY